MIAPNFPRVFLTDTNDGTQKPGPRGTDGNNRVMNEKWVQFLSVGAGSPPIQAGGIWTGGFLALDRIRDDPGTVMLSFCQGPGRV